MVQVMRRRMLGAGIAGGLGMLVSLVFAISTQAAPINASESALGDFYGQLIGAVDVGTNSVSGNLGLQDPGDSFQLSLAAGYNISGVRLVAGSGFGGFSAISALGGGPGGGASFTFTLQQPGAVSYDWLVDVDVTHIGNSDTKEGCFPGQESDCRPPSNPIPEPSAALIFGLGALVVGTASRRRAK